jgi:NADH:ubiquinone oxidoreductase subunit
LLPSHHTSNTKPQSFKLPKEYNKQSKLNLSNNVEDYFPCGGDDRSASFADSWSTTTSKPMYSINDDHRESLYGLHNQQ